jgi:hypothetical protein
VITMPRPPFIYKIAEIVLEEIQEEREREANARRRRISARETDEGSLGGLGDIEAIRRLLDTPPAKKAKRKASAYSKRYARNFKKCMDKHKKKNGQWKKGGYKRCVREAHRMSRK